MADSNIGALPQAPQVDDDSLLVMEQQGQAMKLTGAQLKEYAKRGVELEFQENLAQSQAAADQAVSAVGAVTGMTVEAHSSEEATVSKSTKEGKVHLTFGLPRGEPGKPGPEGPQGLRGPQGPPGNGLTILGHYGTEEALRAAIPAPDVGDAYSIGAELPYDTYVFDGVTNDWKNYGPLSGGGGSILPENVITTPGGAEMEFDTGNGPHTITFTNEEEPPLTAEDIVYGEATVQEAIDGLFISVSDGKAQIASAITDKGVPTQQDAAFAEMAEHIGQITTGSSTEDATATPGDILAGKTAYTASGKVEGVIPALAARTYTPGTAAQTIANGQYLSGTQTIQGDPNLTSSNIKKGVSIFGVAGAVEQSFLATLTVKADTGAVVTATHTNGTKVEALSTNGTVSLELPVEGKWTVTAQRGVAQYNSVMVTVTSQYNAELTAEVHIEYYGRAEDLAVTRSRLAATAVGDYALFGGGSTDINNGYGVNVVDAYSNTLTHSRPESGMSIYGYQLAAETVGDYAIFCGGYSSFQGKYYDNVNCYDTALALTEALSLGEAKCRLAAASIGEFVLFGGGMTASGQSATVDAYQKFLAKSEITGLSLPEGDLAAASNENYAVFGGGGNGPKDVTAYDKVLTRTIPTGLSSARGSLSAARAGNYILFAGGGFYQDTVDAYDLFLTRTTPAALGVGRKDIAGTTLKDYAIFFGGSELSKYSTLTDIYDAYLIRTTVGNSLTTGITELAAATVGDYALFGGGNYIIGGNSLRYSGSVYAYQHI